MFRRHDCDAIIYCGDGAMINNNTIFGGPACSTMLLISSVAYGSSTRWTLHSPFRTATGSGEAPDHVSARDQSSNKRRSVNSRHHVDKLATREILW